MDGGSWHCTGDRNQDHPQGKEMQKSKMAVWGSLTNSCEKKRSEKQRTKGIPVHLIMLIPRMSVFTLDISCLTTSNLPWFMDLTFQFPMQYCSLQYWTSLLSLVPSTTGCCFCFGSMSSCFLELFLHWSPVAYPPGHLPTWGVHLSVSYLFAFS